MPNSINACFVRGESGRMVYDLNPNFVLRTTELIALLFTRVELVADSGT